MALAVALRLANAQYALGQRIGVQFAPPAVGFVVFEQTEQTACAEQVSQPSTQALHSLPPLAPRVARSRIGHAWTHLPLSRFVAGWQAVHRSSEVQAAQSLGQRRHSRPLKLRATPTKPQ